MFLSRLLLFTALAVSLIAPPKTGRAQDVALASVTAKQYVVVDAETGEVFADKQGDGRAGMASVTKLFTLMEAIQRAPLDLEVTALETDMFGSDSTKMTGFFPGARFTLDDVLHGMMLESGNDAAYAVARAVGAQPGDTEAESVDRFVGWVNERAASLGLTNTRLMNPHGLSEPGHYTTPRDLAAFLMYGQSVEGFMRVVVARDFLTSNGTQIFSINRSPEFIPDQIGGKTGYDDATGYCLAEYGERDGRRMIAVTFDGVAPDVWYLDQAILFDVAYSALEARLAADAPVPDNRVAFVPPGGAQPDPELQAAQSPSDVEGDPAPVDVAQEARIPTPVRVDALPEPVADVRDNRSITGDWILPVSILVGLIALTAIRQLGMLDARRPGSAPVDTSDQAS